MSKSFWDLDFGFDLAFGFWILIPGRRFIT
jgi:hypothetical protein